MAFGIGCGVTICFPFSFFSSLFNLPFAFFLFFSLSITSFAGFGKHSSQNFSGKRGQYFEQSSTCLISCSPGFAFLLHFGALQIATFVAHHGKSKVSQAALQVDHAALPIRSTAIIAHLQILTSPSTSATLGSSVVKGMKKSGKNQLFCLLFSPNTSSVAQIFSMRSNCCIYLERQAKHRVQRATEFLEEWSPSKERQLHCS
jgi:hypothetical protein